tara:strand:- start:688 stop:1320 length:633 start_codon:yes stop_codon:yes gene_type:complete
MSSKSNLFNILGQVRMYSLVDLVLLFIAIKASSSQLVGIVLLHLGFIFFLEYTHKHEYRTPFPIFLWVFFLLVGIFFYRSIFVIGFLVFSFFYARKNLPSLSPYGPFFRGLQYYFLSAGIIGLLNPISFLVGGLIVLRNFTGDLRDIAKDKKEGLKTIPIILGFDKDIRFIHILFLFGTSFVWWIFSDISIVWLAVVYLIQISTYNLTSR